MTEPQSWILEIRRRLEAPPGREPIVEATSRRAVLVPLAADAGELWVQLGRGYGDDDGGGAFPGADLEKGEDVWTGALRGAEEQMKIHPKGVLRLGELDAVESFEGGLLTPCIGALPAKLEAEAGESFAEVFRLPLSAFANPSLVEEKIVEVDGLQRRVKSYHIGNRRVWGLAADILEDLLERLGGT
ncbi:MAG: NUDIX domain-containing protein [Acidobacteriota bacterium]